MMIVGLTGSIGMGKTTVGRMFDACGAPVFDADAAVHELYRPGRAGARAVGRAFSGVLDAAGGVDRAKLRDRVQNDPKAFRRLERIVHPLVARARRRFIRRAERRGALVVVLDIPLLFETGGEDQVDAVVVVSAPPDAQRARVLKRPGMTRATLDAILARQVPDAEKRARAGFVVDTSGPHTQTRRQVRRIIKRLSRRAAIRARAQTRRD